MPGKYYNDPNPKIPKKCFTTSCTKCNVYLNGNCKILPYVFEELDIEESFKVR